MKKPFFIFLVASLLLTACGLKITVEVDKPPTATSTAVSLFTTTPTPTATPTPDDSSLKWVNSKAKFQVFILNPVQTCVAGNDFMSGQACYGEKCGDCACDWNDMDPPAPITGISPEHINDPEYAGFAHRVCFNITLTPEEVADIEGDMRVVAEKVKEWTEGTLQLELSFTEIPYAHTGFVAPDFVFGPFEVDDELLNAYVDVDTDFVYVVTGQRDHEQNLDLAGWCGGSYGEMSIHGAGYAYIQYSDNCNSVTIDGQSIYEPLIHEWYHNLDWALTNINQVPDAFEGKNPDWANWQHASWPACNQYSPGLKWFPSIDLCEWDPDWMDCNNTASAGRCIHAGEVDGQPSWYEHVLRVHYPRDIQFIGNYCRNGRQDISETGVDSGWPCP